MLDGVFDLKKVFLFVALLLVILLKIWIPANDALVRQVVAFFGLEQAAVQALGRSLIEVCP